MFSFHLETLNLELVLRTLWSFAEQVYDYLIVIDFESTCWKDGKHHRSPEIIEFPAVLLSTATGEIESEFHAYVQPQEHPVLSEFCTELTGIKQVQVDEGVPLKICLSQFCKWIHKIQQQKKIIFAPGDSEPSPSGVKLCAFVTWSDWDLGVCLEYECKRKQLLKPGFLNSWIDLRATYKVRIKDGSMRTMFLLRSGYILSYWYEFLQ
ncbi:ERI1 exoribonuclease 2 [Lemmus lemmus]